MEEVGEAGERLLYHHMESEAGDAVTVTACDPAG